MTYAATVLADSPLAYYRLGDSSGTTMADSSGNSRPGTYFNTPTLGATGLLTGDADTAVSFASASSEYAQLASAAWMNVAQVTCEAIIKPTTLGATYAIIDRDDPSSGGITAWTLIITTASKLQFYWALSSTNNIIGSTTLVAGNTYHVAATYDGTNARIYLNGVQDAISGTSSGSLKTGTAALTVAASKAGGATPIWYFQGTIDEAAVYGSALSSTRIAAHYTAMTTGGGGGGSSPRGVFHMNDATRRQAVIRASSY